MKTYYDTNAKRQQTIDYNTFKSPYEITAGNEKLSFTYNDNNDRSMMFYGSLDVDKNLRPNRKYYSADGSMEIKTTPSGTEFVTYIGGDAYSATIVYKKNFDTAGIAQEQMLYLHRDYQGSILAITNDAGAILEKRQFDAWGSLISIQNGSSQPIANGQWLLDRGYTGHEHLQSVGLINMNGRLYDPKLHRFLQPDNNIQDPYNTQNYNRYGYVLNNPLKFTDPTGETYNPDFGSGNNGYYYGGWYNGGSGYYGGAGVSGGANGFAGSGFFGGNINNIASTSGGYGGGGYGGGNDYRSFVNSAAANANAYAYAAAHGTYVNGLGNGAMMYLPDFVPPKGAIQLEEVIVKGKPRRKSSSGQGGGNISPAQQAIMDARAQGGGGEGFMNGFMNAPRSDMGSGSAIVGYQGAVLNKNELLIRQVARGASFADRRYINKTLKVTSKVGKAMGIVGVGLTIYEDVSTDGFTWGTVAKAGIGGALIFASAPLSLTYAVIDIGVGLTTGTTITDRVGNYVNQKMK